VIALWIGLGVLGLLVAAGYLVFVRPWSAMAGEEERMRRERENR
jgi:hypothetical protein